MHPLPAVLRLKFTVSAVVNEVHNREDLVGHRSSVMKP